MEDTRWLRVITVGLFLASLAVAYFLLTGKLTSRSSFKNQSQVSKATSTPAPVPTVIGQSTQIPIASPSASPSSAFDRIAERNQGNVQTLPRTGFPAILIIIFSLSALVSGLGLRKFPH